MNARIENQWAVPLARSFFILRVIIACYPAILIAVYSVAAPSKVANVVQSVGCLW